MYLTAAGNVGIGTTAPQAKLDISGGYIRLEELSNNANGWSVWSSGGYLSSRITTSGHSRSWGWEFTDNYPDSATANVFFRVGYNGAVSYLTSGNFGIGTNNPTVHSGGNALVVAGASGVGSGRAIIELAETGGGRAVFQQVGSSTYIGNLAGNGPLILLVGGSGSSASEAVYISNAGNVGISTTAPSAKLHVSGTVSYGSARFSPTNADGESAIAFYADVAGTATSTSWVVGQAGWGHTGDFVIGNENGGAGGNVRFLIERSGNVGIGTTTPSYKLDVVGDSRITSGSLGVGVAPNATDGRIDASNDIVAFQTSDRRLKENITPIANALDKVKSLTGVEFDWKEETKHVHGYEGHDTGIIAQEVQAVMPTAVRTNDSGYLSVRYEKLIGLLVEANKELAARVEELESKLK
jgi:hypothetical protein